MGCREVNDVCTRGLLERKGKKRKLNKFKIFCIVSWTRNSCCILLINVWVSVLHLLICALFLCIFYGGVKRPFSFRLISLGPFTGRSVTSVPVLNLMATFAWYLQSITEVTGCSVEMFGMVSQPI